MADFLFKKQKGRINKIKKGIFFFLSVSLQSNDRSRWFNKLIELELITIMHEKKRKQTHTISSQSIREIVNEREKK